MSARTTVSRVATVQRRIVLAQAVFWPAVVGVGLLSVTAAVLLIRRRRRVAVAARQPSVETGDQLSV
ncbi:MAG: LPXTG cell wall anchor domain-containing protein [Mycobacterium sp.]|nr:LPXTG cell wall anchor domain-containing protein [Mycobacterium sp.]